MKKKERMNLIIGCIILLFLIGRSAVGITQNTEKVNIPQESKNLFVFLNLFLLIFGLSFAIFGKKLANYFYKNVAGLKNKFSLKYLSTGMIMIGVGSSIFATLSFVKLILK
ncbi:MAG: hypothetical protein K9M00_02375 [Candidatus Omnitrophica bacterium]|nr:hypothetical protein [Candidatus Omnitrophota bacterium]